MDKELVIKTLVAFFIAHFAEDPVGTAEWIVDRGLDVDAFYEEVDQL